MPGTHVPLLEPPTLDLRRMRTERHAKLQAAMADQGVGALLLIGGGNVEYATGATLPGADVGRAVHQRTAAVVVAGTAQPHLFTPYPEGAPPGMPAGHVHRALDLETPEGVVAAGRAVADVLGGRPAGTLALDDYTPAMFFGLADALDATFGDASGVMGTAKVCKTPDELECIRRAQHVNELAMYDVQAALRPGLRQSDLSAIFLRRIFELGITSNGIDPIWQVMEPRAELRPWTVHGDLAFPTSTTDRLLVEGDLVWNDSGVHAHGYASDFGRTWIVSADPRPTDAQRSHFRRWKAVVDTVVDRVRPGVAAWELNVAAREANDGVKPWLDHFYLIHGVGTESAELPFVGTDLGREFEESFVLAPGMVLVLEPTIWVDGEGGYRGEEIVAVTDTGARWLTDHPYAPFE